MRLIPCLSFDGQCREASDFYAAALGGQLVGPPMTYGESPMCDDMKPMQPCES